VGIAVLTLGMSLAVLASHGLGVPDPSARYLDGIGVLLVAASTLPLAARELAPMTVYLVTAAPASRCWYCVIRSTSRLAA
jgi:hypothetical protein